MTCFNGDVSIPYICLPIYSVSYGLVTFSALKKAPHALNLLHTEIIAHHLPSFLILKHQIKSPLLGRNTWPQSNPICTIEAKMALVDFHLSIDIKSVAMSVTRIPIAVVKRRGLYLLSKDGVAHLADRHLRWRLTNRRQPNR